MYLGNNISQVRFFVTKSYTVSASLAAFSLFSNNELIAIFVPYD